MPRTASQSPKWNFTTTHNSKGLTYVLTYFNKWDPEKRQSRTAGKHQVGRLHPDGHIAFTPAYLEQHPEFAQGEWFYEGNAIVERTEQQKLEYLQKSPYEYREGFVQVGLTYGLWHLAHEKNIIEDLTEVFGRDTALELMRLAIYQFDSPGAMQNFEDWVGLVFLPGARPLCGQRISEILNTVTQVKMDAYFKRRHDRALGQPGRSEQDNGVISLAFDSTSISTYSTSIADAAYGHAKQNKELAQVNLTFVCDYETGDVLYAFESEGSVPDKAVFRDIVARMIAADFDLSKIMIVTDRGYFSMPNTQKSLDTQVRFLQGLPLVEDVVKRAFDKHREKLQSTAFYSAKLGCSAHTYTEKWTRATTCGNITVDVYVHLYFDEALKVAEQKNLLKKIEEGLEARNAGQSVSADDWIQIKPYIQETKSSKGSRYWIRDNKAIDRKLRYSGCFAIRSDEVSDPYEALRIYRQRGIVEQAFRQYKTCIEGQRMLATESSYLGKLFIYTLAQGLRMTLHTNATRNAKKAAKGLPGNSLTKAMMQLRHVSAERPTGRNLWLLRPVAKKQRDLLSLLGLLLPPKLLRD